MKLFPLGLGVLLSFSAIAQEGASLEIEGVVNLLEGNPPSPAVECRETPEQDPLCSDLATFTCAVGEYDDGTGVSQGREALVRTQAEARARAETRLRQGFTEVLGNPEKAYFREIALGVSGLRGAPDCRNSTSSRCVELLARSLTEKSLNRIFPPEGGMGFPMPPMGGNFQELSYLISSPDFLEVESAEAMRLRGELTDPAFTQKISTEIFPEVRRQLVSVLSSRITDPRLRENLLMKINAIRFEGSDCEMGGGLGGGPSLSGILTPNAFYNSQSNTFRFCNGFLIADRSEFKIANVIAHELAHAIDPCNIANGPASVTFQYQASERPAMEAENPFAPVLACLRSPESVGAKIPSMTNPWGLGIGLPPSPEGGEGEESAPKEESPEGSLGGVFDMGAGPALNPFCGGDQIGESFSDWLAAEVTPRYMRARHPRLTQDQFRNGYSNIFRGMCPQPSANPMMGMGPGVHPEVRDRVNKIILAQPEIRRQMGCQDDPAPVPRYCGESP